MGVEGILTGNVARDIAAGGLAAQPLSEIEALAATAANGNSPLARGDAFRALDQATGDRALSDGLATGTVSLDQVTTSAVAPAQVTLTTAVKVQRLQAALPDALASIHTAATNPALTPAETADLTAAAGMLCRGGTSFTYAAIPNQPSAAAAAATRHGHATITINPSSSSLFKADGTVDKAALSAFLTHEGRHAYDANFYGERNGPSTMTEVRRTERNAYRTEAAYLKAAGATQYATDPKGTVVPLMAATANYAAEASVKSWVGAAVKAAIQTNRAIEANYATYTRQIIAYDKANGTRTAMQPRPVHVPVPSYSPPAGY